MQVDRHVVALDWRGFGLTEAPGADSYWFADYLGDLDAALDRLRPDAAVDLAGHSMGGNVVMIYAGVRPQRVRRLVNLEGFGMPETKPHQAPKRYAQWLDELKVQPQLRDYASEARSGRAADEEQRAPVRRQGGMARPALVAPRRGQRPLAHPRRPGAQARQPGALPQGRSARMLEAHRGTDTVGRGRLDRHRQVVGQPLSARRTSRRASPSCRASNASCSPTAGTCCTTTSPSGWRG